MKMRLFQFIFVWLTITGITGEEVTTLNTVSNNDSASIQVRICQFEPFISMLYSIFFDTKYGFIYYCIIIDARQLHYFSRATYK